MLTGGIVGNGVSVGMGVSVGRAVGGGVDVWVGLGNGVAEAVGDRVLVGVEVDVFVGDGVWVGVAVGVREGLVVVVGLESVTAATESGVATGSVGVGKEVETGVDRGGVCSEAAEASRQAVSPAKSKSIKTIPAQSNQTF